VREPARRAAVESPLGTQYRFGVQVAERAGGIVRIVGSDPGNMKITTREDLRMAELLLTERGS